MMKLAQLILVSLMLTLVLTACGSPAQQPTPDPNMVATNEIGYQLNPQYAPDNDQPRFIEDGFVYPGQKIDPAIQRKEPFAVVPAGQVGVLDGKVYSAGQYPKIPASFMTIEPAANIPAGHIGIYRRPGTSNYGYLATGYQPYRAGDVILIPIDTLRYRTLPPDRVADAAACASYVCEASLSGMLVNSTSATGTADLDIIFQFQTEPEAERAGQLYQMGSIPQVVQNYIATPLRSARALSSRYTTEHLGTAEGREQLTTLYLTHLQEATEGTPLRIISVNLRGLVIGDETYRQQQAAREQALADEQARKAIIQAQIDNQAKEQELQATATQFERDQAALDVAAQATNLRVILDAIGNDPELLRILIQTGSIDLGQGLPTTATPTVVQP